MTGGGSLLNPSNPTGLLRTTTIVSTSTSTGEALIFIGLVMLSVGAIFGIAYFILSRGD